MVRPFSFAADASLVSPVVVSRKSFRWILVGLLVISGGFAAWSRMRPYEWWADAKAACVISGCQVKQDHSNYWVHLKLKVNGNMEHDLEIPVRLMTAAGREISPADTTLEGDKAMSIRSIWLKFWLENDDLDGPLKLSINEGVLIVRSGTGIPMLRSDGSRYYVTHKW